MNKKKIISEAIANKQKSLSEYQSKILLKSAGIKITDELLATSKDEAISAAKKIGYPVALKGCGHQLSHKTELDVIKLKLNNETDVIKAYDDIISKNLSMDGVIVQQMISGEREFVLGFSQDVQFGPTIMFGLGGIYTEVLNDVSFRLAPLMEIDALEMIEEINASKILGEFRSKPAVNKNALVKSLIGLGELAMEFNEISEIDINPLIINEAGEPIAVDGLVILKY